ncbi:uncharacterized protein LOC143203449 [Rhynchophorus ferrugineus]|uniref:uncharacterized protein LOC143203449 n=1 Tax=Rhynchophorus ferrugineus TaxID=354439 RepID=UPI003FCC3914
MSARSPGSRTRRAPDIKTVPGQCSPGLWFDRVSVAPNGPVSAKKRHSHDSSSGVRKFRRKAPAGCLVSRSSPATAAGVSVLVVTIIDLLSSLFNKTVDLRQIYPV